MKYLLKGMESQERIRLLVSLTNIRSPQILEAIFLHYVTGLSVVRASARIGVDFSNLHRAIRELNQVTETIEKIKELDYIKQNNIVA